MPSSILNACNIIDGMASGTYMPKYLDKGIVTDLAMHYFEINRVLHSDNFNGK